MVMKRSVPTHGEPFAYAWGRRTLDSRPARDAVLGAVPLERAVAAGELWVGDLETVSQFFAQPVPDLVTPITDPTGQRKLTAEQLTRVADLGELWIGQLRERAAGMTDRDDDDTGRSYRGEAEDRRRRTSDSAAQRMTRASYDAIRNAQQDYDRKYGGKTSTTHDAARSAIPESTRVQERIIARSRTWFAGGRRNG